MAAPTIPSPPSPPAPSPAFTTTLTATSSNDDFNDNFNQSQQSVSNTARAISIGWIVGIVVIILSFIGAIIAVLMFMRNRKKKRERLAAQFNNGEPKPNWPGNNTYQGPGGGVGPQTMASPPIDLGGPRELGGHEPPPRYEVPNTEVQPREMPNNEVARPPQSKDEPHLNQRSELPV